MTTKTVCTLVPSVNQEISASVESVSASDFNFNAVHNGEACIESLRPEDKGTERQLRFTRALLCTLLGVKSENTITNHVDTLINRGVVNDVKNLTSLNIKNENGNGAVKITLYDLTVFNHLVMRLDTDQAWAMKAKFNDVLVKAETGRILTVEDMIANPDTTIRLLTEIKTLRNQNLQLEVERDEAVRTKAMIGSKREATAMATAAAKSRECKKLTAENEELTAENEELKDAIGRGSNWRTVSMMKSEWIREFGHAPVWQKLKNTFSADLGDDEKPVKDVEEKVILPNGSERVSLAYRYHMKAWERYREYEESLRATDIEIATA